MTSLLLEEVQQMWQVPFIVHSCNLFRDAIAETRSSWKLLPEFSVEQLEAAIVAEGEKEDPLLIQIHVRLLRGLRNRSTIDDETWEEVFKKEIDNRLPEIQNPLDRMQYRWISVREKVILLHNLCEWRFCDAEDTQFGGAVQNIVKDMDADVLRLEPKGKDRQGRTYWYFSGMRLYREGIARRSSKKRKTDDPTAEFFALPEDKDEAPWEIVCNTVEDWTDLFEELPTKGTAPEAVLGRVLRDEVFPGIEEMVLKEEARLRKLELDNAPRRTSSRQQTLRERMAEVTQQREIEQAEVDRALQESEQQERPQAREARAALRERARISLRTTDDWSVRASQVLIQLVEHRSSWPFREPVTDAQAPLYSQIIKHPTDLATIEKKLEDGQFDSVDAFRREVLVMFQNCRLYNAPDTVFVQLANSLEEFFKKKLSKFFPDLDDADLDNLAQDEPEDSKSPTADAAPAAPPPAAPKPLPAAATVAAPAAPSAARPPAATSAPPPQHAPVQKRPTPAVPRAATAAPAAASAAQAQSRVPQVQLTRPATNGPASTVSLASLTPQQQQQLMQMQQMQQQQQALQYYMQGQNPALAGMMANPAMMQYGGFPAGMAIGGASAAMMAPAMAAAQRMPAASAAMQMNPAVSAAMQMNPAAAAAAMQQMSASSAMMAASSAAALQQQQLQLQQQQQQQQRSSAASTMQQLSQAGMQMAVQAGYPVGTYAAVSGAQAARAGPYSVQYQAPQYVAMPAASQAATAAAYANLAAFNPAYGTPVSYAPPFGYQFTSAATAQPTAMSYPVGATPYVSQGARAAPAYFVSQPGGQPATGAPPAP
eukprot:m.11472 g.11472  ORF g.11472 m.11472 type:complete len:824 (+) comp2634_c0_seq1:91-2562(+)